MEPTQSVIRPLQFLDQGATGLSQSQVICAQTARSMRPCGDIMGPVAGLDTVSVVNPSAATTTWALLPGTTVVGMAPAPVAL